MSKYKVSYIKVFHNTVLIEASSTEEARMIAQSSPDVDTSIYNNLTFGEWLVRQRKLRGFSQLELADNVGISHTYIGKFERNTLNPATGKLIRPSIKIITALAKALHVNEDEVRQAAGYTRSRQDNKRDIFFNECKLNYFVFESVEEIQSQNTAYEVVA